MIRLVDGKTVVRPQLRRVAELLGLGTEAVTVFGSAGAARVRVQMSAAIEEEHIDRTLAAFDKVGKELGLL